MSYSYYTCLVCTVAVQHLSVDIMAFVLEEGLNYFKHPEVIITLIELCVNICIIHIVYCCTMYLISKCVQEIGQSRVT